ncbi:Uncharacterised protein [Enterobacter cancerogenus]|uniref:Uncharacterized protein n=1 Tax=Enterobacter cancerogenus TaxID=69218 RepID=A0A484YD07_9ENTR|nr:Uncharacterised protein [Enterobacter cancerogenus]
MPQAVKAQGYSTIGASVAVGAVAVDVEAAAISCFSATPFATGATETEASAPCTRGWYGEAVLPSSRPGRSAANACRPAVDGVRAAEGRDARALRPSALFGCAATAVCWCGSMAINALSPASSSSVSEVFVSSFAAAEVNDFSASPVGRRRKTGHQGLQRGSVRRVLLDQSLLAGKKVGKFCL